MMKGVMDAVLESLKKHKGISVQILLRILM
jgi:hypothetical protein